MAPSSPETCLEVSMLPLAAFFAEGLSLRMLACTQESRKNSVRKKNAFTGLQPTIGPILMLIRKALFPQT